MRPAELLRLRLRCDASAPARARDALARLSPISRVRDEAVLVVSELATNAVLHSGCQPGEEFEVVAELMPACLRIVVTDPGHSGDTPRRRDPPLGSAGGLGLRVVDKLARRWGSEQRGTTRVWAELAL